MDFSVLTQDSTRIPKCCGSQLGEFPLSRGEKAVCATSQMRYRYECEDLSRHLSSIGGTGGVFDAPLGGPGGPGGTVNRYLAFMLFGLITTACYAAITATWNCARYDSR